MSVKLTKPDDSSLPDERLKTGYPHKSPTHPTLSSSHARARRAVFLEDTWHKLAPELHVEDEAFSQPNCASPHNSWEHERNQMLNDGYSEIKKIDWGNINLEHVACAVANLQRHGWPPVFVLVYDEIWLMAFKFIGMLRATNTHLHFNMDFWAWYIDPLKPYKGKDKPHRDRPNMPFDEVGTEKLPMYSTVWVALTEATPTNSCLFVVPAKWDENYLNTGDSDAQFDPQNLRPIPVKAGDAIAWSGRIIHFGGRAEPSAEFPRMSIAFAASVAEFENPALRLGRPFPQFTNAGGDEVNLRMPTLRERLRVIASQLETYDQREELTESVAQVLEAIKKSSENGEEEDYFDEDDDVFDEYDGASERVDK